MALFRKFFLKKTPDRLLEISERVYVFDCCFSTEIMGEDEYRDYFGGIVAQLQDYFPDASFMVSNFRVGDKRSRISDILSEYDMTVMDYPQQYEGCPLLQLEMVHHFLKSCENWLSVEGQHNMLLMHCERGGWPVLSFMLAGLLLYRKTYTGEQKTLEIVYKQARKDFIQQFFPLNPQPSHLRYLHYITRQGSGSEWPPRGRPFTLESLVLQVVPKYDVHGGCRPMVRVHGQDSLAPGNRSSKILFETPKMKKHLRHYGQAGITPIRISARCLVQGDVVLECIHIADNLEHEEIMFQIMFNTAFIQSNTLVLNRDDIDVMWNVRDQFPKDFRAEVLFSDPDAFKSNVTTEGPLDDGNETDVGSLDAGEEFYEAEEDWQDARKDPETQSIEAKTSSDDDHTEPDIGVASETGNKLENDNTKEDVKIVISQNSSALDTKGRALPTPNSLDVRSGSVYAKDDKQTNAVQGKDTLGISITEIDTYGQENTAVQDIEVIATSVGVEGHMLQSSGQKEDTKGVIAQTLVTIADPIGEHEAQEQAGESTETSKYIDLNCSAMISTSRSLSSLDDEDAHLRTTQDEVPQNRDVKVITENLVIMDDEPVIYEEKNIVDVGNLMQEVKNVVNEERITEMDRIVMQNSSLNDNSHNLETAAEADAAKSRTEQAELKYGSESIISKKKSTQDDTIPKLAIADVATEMKTKIEGPIGRWDVDKVPSQNKIESKATNHQIESDIRRQAPETSVPSLSKKLPTCDVIEPVISKAKLGQNRLLEDQPKSTKQKTIRRWISPKKESDATSVHRPSHPPSRYDSSPAALAIRSISIDNKVTDMVDASPTLPSEGCTDTFLLEASSNPVSTLSMVPRQPPPPPPPPPPFSQTGAKINGGPSAAPPSPFSRNLFDFHTPPSSPHPPPQTTSPMPLPPAPPTLPQKNFPIRGPPQPPPPPPMPLVTSTRSSPCVPSPPPPPPPLPSCHQPFPSLMQNLPPPPPPPPPPPSSPFVRNSFLAPPPPPPMQSQRMNQDHLSPPPPPPRLNGGGVSPPPPPPPPPRRLNAIGFAPPPPPPPPIRAGNMTSPTPPPPPPPPPPLSSSSTSKFTRASILKPPPPPPPPPLVARSSAPSLGVCVGAPPPPPPPPLGARVGAPPPPPPPPPTGAHVGTPTPPPPPLGGRVGAPPPPPPPPPGGGRVPPPPPPPGGRVGAPPPPPLGGGRAPPPPPPPGARAGGPPPPPAPGARVPGPSGPPRAPGAPPLPSQGNSFGLLSNPLGGGRGRGPMRSAGFVAPRKSTLKPLHWVKVTRALQGSLWEELQRNDDSQSASEFDLSELESLFPAAIPKSNDNSKSEGRRKSLGSKPDKVHLIELRRANNTEIMLTKVKMPLPDLVSAALALDESTLDVDQVENLIKFCPTKEEMELLKNYTGDKENLGKCEQYFLELMKVPRMESKLRVFSFKIQFGSQVADLRKSLNTIESSCNEIRKSLKLKEIMKKILLLGNTLNMGTARGSAVGFRLDSLLKLTDTRATNNKMTLMHYLCKVLTAKSPHLLDFHVDLVSLEAASKIQLKLLAEEMQAVSKGLEKVQLEFKASESDGPVSEIFREKLKEFSGNAGAGVQSLSSLFSEVGKKADALIKYFGEDPVRCPFEQVISTLLIFVTMFRKAHQENCKQAELEKKKAEKEAEAEKSKAAHLASKNDSKPTNASRQAQQKLEKTKAISRRENDVG